MNYYLYHFNYLETGKYLIVNEKEREELLKTGEWFSGLRDVKDASEKKIEIKIEQQEVEKPKRGRPQNVNNKKHS